MLFGEHPRRSYPTLHHVRIPPPRPLCVRRPGALRTIGGSPGSKAHHVKLLRRKRPMRSRGLIGIESSREVPRGNSSLPIPWCQFPPPISFPSRTGNVSRPSPSSNFEGSGVPKIGHFMERAQPFGERHPAREEMLVGAKIIPFPLFLFFPFFRDQELANCDRLLEHRASKWRSWLNCLRGRLPYEPTRCWTGYQSAAI